MTWTDQLDDRQQKELKLARLYDTKDFRHGTTGHADLLLIAKLADLLDQFSGELQLARLRAPEPVAKRTTQDLADEAMDQIERDLDEATERRGLETWGE